MTRRPGLSLTEVLVAVFITGIGTIAVLTLFPLGALNMAQAFRDDRCTQATYQADAYLRAYIDTARDRGTLSAEKFAAALDDPSAGTSGHMPKISTAKIGAPKPSYPVLIDPMGYKARGGTNDNPTPATDRILWAADNGFGYGDSSTGAVNTRSPLARRSLRTITSTPVLSQQPLAIRTCSLLDGFGYDLNGQPAPVAGGSTLERDLRYNWMWLLQKPDADSAATNVTVIVFDKRSPGYAPAGVALETIWKSVNAATGTTRLSFVGSYDANTLPTVQRGGWLLDCSVALINRPVTAGPKTVVPFNPAGTLTATQFPWIRNAHFYRVASVTETGAGIDVELEVPLRPDTGRNPDPAAGEPVLPADQRRFVYLSGVAEVFERKATVDVN